MKSHFKFTAVIIAIICFSKQNLLAQSLEDMQAKYHGEMAVNTKHIETVTIKMKDDNLVAESVEEHEFMVLDEKANGLYNKHRIYHSGFRELKEIEAYTIAPDGSKRGKKIKVTEFKTQDSHSNSVFYDDMKETTFDFPQAVKGAVCNVNTTKFFKDIHMLPVFYFASYMPVDEYKYVVEVPEKVDLKYIVKNNSSNIINVNTYQKGSTNYFEFTAKKVMPIETLGGTPGIGYYEPHVIIYVASYKKSGEERKVFSSLDDLYKWNYDFTKNINKEVSPVLKNLADSLTKGLSSQKEKAQKIYQWVQEHIKYVAFEDGLEGFIPRQAADVCNKKYGDCKDMSSLITTLLNLAGVEAHYTWIGTRQIPYKYTEVWLPITDNHMISTAKIDGNWIFLDGTDPNCIFGFPSDGIQTKQALVAINENEYKVLDVPTVEPLKNLTLDSTFISIDNNSIKGKSSVNYYGYSGIQVWNDLQYKSDDDLKDYAKTRMGKASNKFILGDYKINKVDNNNKVVNITANFEIPDYCKKVSDEIYINLNLERFFSGTKIDTAKIKVPFDNDYLYCLKQYTVLDLPAGYEVEYKPKDINVSNEIFDIEVKYSINKNKLIVAQVITYKTLMVEPTLFPIWNKTSQQLSTYYKEQVVLKKTSK